MDHIRRDEDGRGRHSRAPGLAASFILFTLLYIFLAVTVAYLLWEQVIESPKLEEAAQTVAAGR
jgi:cytochrome bd-type quinol oxidase subunit 1